MRRKSSGTIPVILESPQNQKEGEVEVVCDQSFLSEENLLLNPACDLVDR